MIQRRGATNGSHGAHQELAIAILLSICSWTFFGVSFGLPALVTSSEVYTGWDALRFASDGSWGFHRISAMTNVAMLITPLGFLARWPALIATMAALMGIATLVNSWWFVGFPDARSDLGTGYYLWLFSFGMATIAQWILYGWQNGSSND
jgi:hypothetical protein